MSELYRANDGRTRRNVERTNGFLDKNKGKEKIFFSLDKDKFVVSVVWACKMYNHTVITAETVQ